jgi:two-component system chemotaxis sensor kinase CheA
VDVALLNRMMNLVGELVLTRNQVLQATSFDSSMTMLSRRLDMVTADLREAVMKARMQPVSNIFSKMPRMVRDLTHTLGRRVRLEMEGQAGYGARQESARGDQGPVDTRGAQCARSRH